MPTDGICAREGAVLVPFSQVVAGSYISADRFGCANSTYNLKFAFKLMLESKPRNYEGNKHIKYNLRFFSCMYPYVESWKCKEEYKSGTWSYKKDSSLICHHSHLKVPMNRFTQIIYLSSITL